MSTTWKKMAEAFGRAIHEMPSNVEHAPRTDKSMNKAINKDVQEYNKFLESAKSADADEEFRRGFNDEELLPDRDVGKSKIQAGTSEYVEPKDYASVDRNQAEFDEVFDNAVNEATNRHTRGASDAETERMRAKIRREAIEMLKDDRYDISDVLDCLLPYRTGDK